MSTSLLKVGLFNSPWRQGTGFKERQGGSHGTKADDADGVACGCGVPGPDAAGDVCGCGVPRPDAAGVPRPDAAGDACGCGVPGLEPSGVPWEPPR